MKHKIIALASALTMLFVLNSCDKYEDGPSLSLKPKLERFSNNWKYEYLLENDLDVTARVDTTTMEILNNGSFTINSYEADSLYQVSGFWYFLGETDVIFYYADPPMIDDRDTVEILLIKEKELWLRDIQDGKTLESHLIPVE